MKKTIIFIAVIVVIIVSLCIAAHYLPVWFSITTVIAFIVGGIFGWIAKVFYNKYIKK